MARNEGLNGFHYCKCEEGYFHRPKNMKATELGRNSKRNNVTTGCDVGSEYLKYENALQSELFIQI